MTSRLAPWNSLSNALPDRRRAQPADARSRSAQRTAPASPPTTRRTPTRLSSATVLSGDTPPKPDPDSFVNRTGFPGGSISWEDGLGRKTESVITGGTGASASASARARAPEAHGLSGRIVNSSGRTTSCARPRRFGAGGARRPTEDMVGFIDAHRAAWGVESICAVPAHRPGDVLRAQGSAGGPDTAAGAGGARWPAEGGDSPCLDRKPPGLRFLQGVPAVAAGSVRGRAMHRRAADARVEPAGCGSRPPADDDNRR